MSLPATENQHPSLHPKTTPAPSGLASTSTLGDVATSFAETARSYDKFVEATNFSFTSAADIAKMHTLSSALRKQLKEMDDVLKAHSAAAKVATRIEVTSPDGDTILSTGEFSVDASGAEGSSGSMVKDVTGKLRDMIRAWRQEKRAELFQELLGAYEGWFPPWSVSTEIIRKPYGSLSKEYVCREIAHYRVRAVDPFKRQPEALIEGTLSIQWIEEDDEAHYIVDPPAARQAFLDNIEELNEERKYYRRHRGDVKIEFHHDPTEPAEVVVGRDAISSILTNWLGVGGDARPSSEKRNFDAFSAQVSDEGKLQLRRYPEKYVDFDFIEDGAELAKEACSKIRSLDSKILSRCGLFDEKSKNIDIRSLDALSDGKAAKLIEKFEAACEIEHPFLFQFARWRSSSNSPIESVEAVPFAGDDGKSVDPEQIQFKSLLDLAKDASIAEFGDPGILLRFHVIVAATPAPPAVSSW